MAHTVKQAGDGKFQIIDGTGAPVDNGTCAGSGVLSMGDREWAELLAGLLDILAEVEPDGGAANTRKAKEIVWVAKNSYSDSMLVLARASELLGGLGVESIMAGTGSSIDYVNMGDTYASTLAHNGRGFVITSWGQWLESEEASAAEDEENPEGTCGNCGEWGSILIRSRCHTSFHRCEYCKCCSSCGGQL